MFRSTRRHVLLKFLTFQSITLAICNSIVTLFDVHSNPWKIWPLERLCVLIVCISIVNGLLLCSSRVLNNRCYENVVNVYFYEVDIVRVAANFNYLYIYKLCYIYKNLLLRAFKCCMNRKAHWKIVKPLFIIIL